MELNYKELADKYFDEALDLLKKLVEFDSVLTEYNENSDAPFGKGAKDALLFFLDNAKKDGFDVLNSDNFAGHVEYGTKGELLGILGHLDVVPVVGDWKSDPFKADIRDGKLYARGSIDDKGPVVASYIALKILKDLNIKPTKRIRLIVGCDEESGSRCLKHYFKKEEMPSIGFSPDADFPLIYGEKAFNNFNLEGNIDSKIIKSWISGDRLNIVPDKTEVVLNKDFSKEFKKFLSDNNYDGSVDGNKYTVYGKASHGSLPEGGINANFIMADFINTIEENNYTKMINNLFSWTYKGEKLGIDINNGDMGDLSLNPGKFLVSDGKAMIGCDCRVPSNDHFDFMDKTIKEKAMQYGFKYVPDKRVLMHYVDPNSNLVKTLYNAYKVITGDNLNKPFTIGGGTYAKFIPNCVAFGALFPGEEDVMHQANEYFNLESFRKTIAIYLKAIYDLVR